MPRVGSLSKSSVHMAMSINAQFRTLSWVVYMLKQGLSEALQEGRDNKGLRTRSVINLSSAWVKALEAISLWSSLPQFLESDSASVSEYNCTFGFRWARRLRTAAMTFRALLSVADLLTMSHLLTICSYTINSLSNHSIFFLVFFFWSRAPFYDFSMICLSWWGVEKGVKRGQNDEKRHICHSNHHSIKSWHRFNLKEFMDNHRHLDLPYTNLQEDLGSSDQDRVRREILSIGGANGLNPWWTNSDWAP